MEMLMALDVFGVEFYQKGNTYKTETPCNREVRQYMRDIGKMLIYWADHNVYSIEGSMNQIITVGHKHS